jgi:hypothetical protein
MSRPLIAGLLGGLAVLLAVSAARAMTFEDLKILIQNHGLTSVEAVVARLPVDLRGNFTLAYSSQSLQGADHDNPRAILFGSDATLVLTFNGHPQQRRYDELEVLQFRTASREFELYSIKFGDEVTFSGPNPAICLSCHGRSPRPIWGGYDYEQTDDNHWPGFYGSTHDAPASNDVERQAFVRFRERALLHPRYRHLQWRMDGAPWFPYGEGAYQHRLRPNNRLGNLLARLNALKIAHEAASGDFLQHYPNTALLWLLQCPQTQLDKFAPWLDTVFEMRFRRNRNHALYRDLDAVDPANRALFQLEKLLSGLEVYTWNMSVSTLPRGKRFSTGIVTIDQLVTAALLGELRPSITWLRQYHRPWKTRQLYDTFREGYYDANVAPGGVGEQYDKLGLYYDAARARQACVRLAASVVAEQDRHR